MKKLLILTMSAGGGHNSAANSLENQFIKNDYCTYKVDIAKYTNKVMYRVLSNAYKVLVCDFPKIYGEIYKISDAERFNNGFSKHAFKILKNKIYKNILNIQPDIIIGTHAFAVSIVSNLKSEKLINCPFISVITDYKVHYAYVHEQVDAYVTGSQYTKSTMISKNVPAYKIFPYGIPIKNEFLKSYKLKNRKNNCIFTVLIMGGSMGIRVIGKVVKELVKNKNKLKIIVVCGENKILKNNLERKYKQNTQNHRIDILGYTDEIPELMESSDIVITKPGGLTVTEAIYKKLPIIIPFAIPGQEEENSDYLVKTGAAIRLNKVKEINEKVNYLIENPNEYAHMKMSMKKLSNKYSITNIIQLSDRLIHVYSSKDSNCESSENKLIYMH